MKRSPRIWPALAAPGATWLLALFGIPFYAVACVAFGTIDPIFRDAVPQWNPLAWDFGQAHEVLTSAISGPLQGVFLRTIVYVIAAMITSFVVGFPVAYFLARHAGKHKLLLLTLVIVPFWVNYLMRMLAWVTVPEATICLVACAKGLGMSMPHHPTTHLALPDSASSWRFRWYTRALHR